MMLLARLATPGAVIAPGDKAYAPGRKIEAAARSRRTAGGVEEETAKSFMRVNDRKSRQTGEDRARHAPRQTVRQPGLRWRQRHSRDIY